MRCGNCKDQAPTLTVDMVRACYGGYECWEQARDEETYLSEMAAERAVERFFEEGHILRPTA